MNKKGKIKDIVKSLILFMCIAVPVLTIIVPVLAQSGGGMVEETLGEIAKPTKLPGFDTASHADASYEYGASNITSAIYFTVDLMKYLMGTIAVIVIIASGVRLVTAGKEIEEVSSNQKENIKYAIIGLILIIVADVFVKQVFFGEAGEIYQSSADVQMAAERGSETIRGIYDLMAIFMGVIAILMIVASGIQMVVSGGNEEALDKGKKAITWAVVGLVILGLAEFVVKDIIFPNQGAVLPDTVAFAEQIKSITNFASGFIATIAVGFYMYGGFLYVTAAGKEDKAGDAKKVFIGATIGIVIALAAFAVVNTFIKMDSEVAPSVDDVIESTFPAN